MSFITNNQNFLHFGFDIPLRGLTASDRALKYQKEIRPEARKRFREYYQTILNDIAGKLSFYRGVIERFGQLEQQFLLYSIYFDTDADHLIFHLSPDIISYFDLTAEPLRQLFENEIERHDNSIIKGYLKQYFFEILDLSPGQWEEEDNSRNPITNKLTQWLAAIITDELANEQNVEQLLINYTKLWNVYFTHPYNSTKALILIHKLFEQYKLRDPQKIKIDLLHCFSNINRFLNELLSPPFYSPLTDIENRSALSVVATYGLRLNDLVHVNKNNEFQRRLKQDCIFFQDLGKLAYSTLMIQACTNPDPARKAYLAEIRKRQATGKPPTFSEIEGFLTELDQNYNQEDIDQRALAAIISDNYLFFA